jgi:predicted HAD superfamily Cof-like phosphohydrolase
MTTTKTDYTRFVEQFQNSFETSKDPELWSKLVREESDEVQKAMAELLKELCDLRYVTEGALLVEPDPARRKEISDLIEEFHSFVVEAFGEDIFEEAFLRVHLSNMSKLGDDGKPVRREDGKVMKGPNYKPPYLLDLV